MKLRQMIRRIRRAPLRYRTARALASWNMMFGEIGRKPLTLLQALHASKRVAIGVRALGVTCDEAAEYFTALGRAIGR